MNNDFTLPAINVSRHAVMGGGLVVDASWKVWEATSSFPARFVYGCNNAGTYGWLGLFTRHKRFNYVCMYFLSSEQLFKCGAASPISLEHDCWKHWI